ncbi:MAG: 3-phosphoserine/phosphohydroxythreonine transaminase, partial [Rhodothermales bacterium]
RPQSRSQMNVCFRLPDEDLEKRFIAEAAGAGLQSLKGHRSVGGIRASLYNACPEGAIDTLVSFMREFERVNG